MNRLFSTKWAHYLPVYERVFPASPMCILEIGVHQGGSLHTWKRNHPKAVVAGIDIDPRCRKAATDGIKVFIGRQSDRRFLSSVVDSIPPMDVVIDDGSHRPYDQINSFKALWPHVRPGGIYIIEDTIVGYERRWRWFSRLTGLDLNSMMIRLVDRMNTEKASDIKSVEFHPWMVCVRKGATQFVQQNTGNIDCRLIGTTHEPCTA